MKKSFLVSLVVLFMGCGKVRERMTSEDLDRFSVLSPMVPYIPKVEMVEEPVQTLKASKIIYIFTKGEYCIKIIEEGKKNIWVNPNIVTKVSYEGYEEKRLKAKVFLGDNLVLQTDEEEIFSEGAWIWFFDGRRMVKSKNLLVLPPEKLVDLSPPRVMNLAGVFLINQIFIEILSKLGYLIDFCDKMGV